MYYYIYNGTFYESDELKHHGIKGMKWGVRRYQNLDGSLTAAGRKRLIKEFDSATKKSNRQLKMLGRTNTIDNYAKTKTVKMLSNNKKNTTGVLRY